MSGCRLRSAEDPPPPLLPPSTSPPGRFPRTTASLQAATSTLPTAAESNIHTQRVSESAQAALGGSAASVFDDASVGQVGRLHPVFAAAGGAGADSVHGTEKGFAAEDLEKFRRRVRKVNFESCKTKESQPGGGLRSLSRCTHRDRLAFHFPEISSAVKCRLSTILTSHSTPVPCGGPGLLR